MVIAVVGVSGLVLVLSETDAGSAPGNGQQIFDSPGCLPKRYDGPDRAGHYLLNRDCPTPTPVILRRSLPADDGWLVRFDGSRSFDPMGGQLVEYRWDVGVAPRRTGRAVSIRYTQPGAYRIVLYVTDDSGLTGTASQVVRLP
jgi:hypothetical protein